MVIEMAKHLRDHLEGKKESYDLRDKTKFLSIAVERGFISEETRRKVLKRYKKLKEKGEIKKVGEILRDGTKGNFDDKIISAVLKEQEKQRAKLKKLKVRRKEVRISNLKICSEEIEIRAQLDSSNGFFKAFLDDFSPSGIGIKTTQPLIIGSIIKLEFYIGNDFFNLETKILYKYDDGTKYGAQFINVKDDVQRALNSAYGSCMLAHGAY